MEQAFKDKQARQTTSLAFNKTFECKHGKSLPITFFQPFIPCASYLDFQVQVVAIG
jgi:hypothetical protein